MHAPFISSCPHRRVAPAHRTLVKTHGFGEIVRSIFDFESWAPRSARQWRLKPVPGEAITKADLPDDDDDNDLLQQLRQRQAALGTTDTASMPDDGDLHRSLTARYAELGGEVDIFAPSTPLTGAVLQELVLAKFGAQGLCVCIHQLATPRLRRIAVRPEHRQARHPRTHIDTPQRHVATHQAGVVCHVASGI